MKIVIPGGSGQVGQLLARAFQNDGHDVVILTRQLASGRRGGQSFGMRERWEIGPRSWKAPMS